MSNPSLKKEILSRFSVAPLIDELKDNDVHLVTAFGVVSGRPSPEEKPGQISNLIDAIVSSYREEHGLTLTERLPGNDGCLVLENVSIKTTNNDTFNFSELVLFYDQIIGVSLGKLQR